MYTEPGDSPELPTSIQVALDLFSASPLASQLGEVFSQNFVVLGNYELALAHEAMAGDADIVTEWERQRYLEHT